MTTYDKNEIKKILKIELDVDRYEHTIGVMYTAAALAMRYEYDIEKAQLAGLLHDCAKAIPNKTKLELCRQAHIPITKSEETNPFLLHAKLGAHFATEKYGVDDVEILDAIKCHTTGKPDMGLLDKIVYIADYIEPKRNKAKNLAVIRKTAFTDLDEALYMILSDSLFYLIKKHASIDNMTEASYLFYKKLLNK